MQIVRLLLRSRLLVLPKLQKKAATKYASKTKPANPSSKAKPAAPASKKKESIAPPARSTSRHSVVAAETKKPTSETDKIHAPKPVEETKMTGRASRAKKQPEVKGS